MSATQWSWRWVAFGLAMVLGLAATWLTRALALRLGIVDRPNPIVAQHVSPVAYLGGVGVAIATAATLALVFALGPETGEGFSLAPAWRLLAGGGLFLVLGVADDLTAMAPAPKFLLQAIAAGVAVLALGVRGPELTPWPVANTACAFLWILTLVNAFNLTDVCDGLVGGLAAIALGFLALLLPGPYRLLALAAAGACLGFLAFNRPPASIFLGDAGSHFLGFLVAALGLELVTPGAPAVELPRLALLAAVPLFELTFLVLVRTRKGIPWWRGSPDHFSLRLQAAGFSRGQTDLIAWTAAGGCATLALLLPALAPLPRAGALVATLLLLLAAAAWLWRLPNSPQAP